MITPSSRTLQSGWESPSRSLLWLIFIGTIVSFFSSSFNCCPFGFPFASFRDLNLSLGGKGITGKIVDSSKLSFSLPCFGVTIFLASWTKFSFKQIESLDIYSNVWLFKNIFSVSYGSCIASGLHS